MSVSVPFAGHPAQGAVNLLFRPCLSFSFHRHPLPTKPFCCAHGGKWMSLRASWGSPTRSFNASRGRRPRRSPRKMHAAISPAKSPRGYAGRKSSSLLLSPRIRIRCWVVRLFTRSISSGEVPPSGIGSLHRLVAGGGVVSRAVRLLAQWGFTELGLARTELTCSPDNEASQRVAGRCGFVREGVLRSQMPFKGGRRDTVVFSLLPGELR